MPISDCQGCPERMTLIDKESYMNDINVIAKKIGIDWAKVEFNQEQFEMGLNAEMKEHHDDPQTKVIDTKEQAAKVAWAHLKEDPHYYTKLKKMEESAELNNILLKIENKTVSIDDFNSLIKEATPASVIDRVRRKMNPKNRINRRRHDKKGHASGLPKIAARVNPARKRSNNTQMTHGGKQGHRRSVRTQDRNRRNQVEEAIEFFKNHIGKKINESLIDQSIDRSVLKNVAIKLMSKPHIDREWLSEFIRVTNV